MLPKSALRATKQPLLAVGSAFRQSGRARTLAVRASENGRQGMELQRTPSEWPGMDIFRRRGGGLWRELDDMKSKMDQMARMMDMDIGEMIRPGMVAGIQVAVDVQETDEAFILKADAPGMSKEDIKVQVSDDGRLTISGERKMEKVEEKAGFLRAERAYGNFSRSLKFPKAIKADNVKAKFEKGELVLTVPKAEPEKTVTKEVPIE